MPKRNPITKVALKRALAEIHTDRETALSSSVAALRDRLSLSYNCGAKTATVTILPTFQEL
jgi:hypothetical protein